MRWIDEITEIIFFIQICVNFVTEYYPSGSNVPERNIKKIARRYIEGNFVIHLIPVLPFSKFIHF